MAPALHVESAFFPLDDQLGLLGGGLTPRGEEILMRLASWMPYECARQMLEDVLGLRVSKASACRATMQTGEAALEVWDAEVERLQQEMPQAPIRGSELFSRALLQLNFQLASQNKTNMHPTNPHPKDELIPD
jgi:hypothetical protein